jgi:hypothetical protein
VDSYEEVINLAAIMLSKRVLMFVVFAIISFPAHFLKISLIFIRSFALLSQRRIIAKLKKLAPRHPILFSAYNLFCYHALQFCDERMIE